MAFEIPIISSAAKFFFAMATFSKTVEDLRQENQKIKDNYLDRFEKVYEKQNNMERNIIDKMNENHIAVIDRINARK